MQPPAQHKTIIDTYSILAQHTQFRDTQHVKILVQPPARLNIGEILIKPQETKEQGKDNCAASYTTYIKDTYSVSSTTQRFRDTCAASSCT